MGRGFAQEKHLFAVLFEIEFTTRSAHGTLRNSSGIARACLHGLLRLQQDARGHAIRTEWLQAS